MSQLGWLFPIYGKIKHVPNHQPDIEVQKQHVDRTDISLCINQICLNDNIEKWEENEVWRKYATFIGSILNFTDKIQQTMVLMQQERYCIVH